MGYKWNEEMISMQGPPALCETCHPRHPRSVRRGINKVIDDMYPTWPSTLSNLGRNPTNIVNIFLPDSITKPSTNTPTYHTSDLVATGADTKTRRRSVAPANGGRCERTTSAPRRRPVTGPAALRLAHCSPSPRHPRLPVEAVGQGTPRRDQIRPRSVAVPRRPVRAGARPAVTGRAVRRSDARRRLRRGERAGVLRRPAADHRSGPRPGREAQGASRARARQPVDGRADQKAKWKEHQAEVDLQKAQAALVDKTKGTAKDLKQGMTELSAGLDPDLGLGKGLSGLADNLVRFVGKLAFAGTERGLQDTVDATEAAPASRAATACSGCAAPTTSPGLVAAAGQSATAGATQSGRPGVLRQRRIIEYRYRCGGAGYPGDAALLANVPAGRWYTDALR
jgi:hypothetical protein